MFCLYCGAPVPEGAEVCPACGGKVLVQGTKTDLEQEETRVFTVEPEGDGRDIYSSAPHRFRPEPEMEDIYSSGDIPQAEPVYEEPPVQSGPAFEVYTGPKQTVYEDGYVYEEYEEGMRERVRRPWLWLVILIPVVLLLLGGAIWAYVWYNAPAQEFERALAADDYNRITQLLPQLEEEDLNAAAGEMQAYALDLVEKYNRGEAEYNSTYGLVERLQRLFPDVPELSAAVRTMQTLKTSKETFIDAQSADQLNDVNDALRLYGLVAPEDTNYPAAQERIEAITADYKASVLAEADRLAGKEDFLGAQAALLNSTAILGEDPDILAKMEALQDLENETYVLGMLETAAQLAAEEDWIGAVHLLEEATREDDRFTQQIEAYTQNYKMHKLAEAAELADEGSYEEAVAVLEGAQDFLEDDEEVAEQIKIYKDLYPVLLVDLAHTGGENCDSGWNATDVNGTKYSNGLSFALYPIIAQDVYTEYSPAGKYKLFSGTWVVEEDTTEDFIGEIRVYVDGVLQYQLTSLTRSSTPMSMNLKIEGAKTIRIEAEGAFAGLRETGYIYLAGATFRN